MDHFRRHGLTTDHPPIVAVGPHSGDPHYAPDPRADTPIRRGDFVLIDLWAKLDRPRAVYSDLTRVGFVGERGAGPVSRRSSRSWPGPATRPSLGYARRSRRADRCRAGRSTQAARDVIEEAGYGARFVHRTGHTIGQETHGNGANMDNLETHEERRVLPRTCFSVEPGIYLPEFGVRSEVNVFVDADGQVHVTGGRQSAVVPILAAGEGERVA